MRKVFLFVVALTGIVGGSLAWWRGHPRVGAEWTNRVVDPWLVRQGVVASSKGEIGLLEHVGRKSSVVRVTPVHPVRTPEGFRIIVPLGVESHWANNVIAAGHCRLQVGDVVHELDEPRLVLASEVDGLAKPPTRLMDWLGFRYLLLHQFAEGEGTLTMPIEVATESTSGEAVPAA